jgi:uncharacterized C2H2 Zn-finger protein
MSTLSSDDYGVLEFHPKDGTVTVGKEIFPLSSVQRMRSVDGEICPDCGLDFQDTRALGAHRKHKHEIDSTFGTMQTCPDCGEQFKNLKSHKKFKHTEKT